MSDLTNSAVFADETPDMYGPETGRVKQFIARVQSLSAAQQQRVRDAMAPYARAAQLQDEFRFARAADAIDGGSRTKPYLVARVVRSFALGLIIGFALLFVGALDTDSFMLGNSTASASAPGTILDLDALPNMLSGEEVAAILHVSRASSYRWVHRLGAVRYGSSKRHSLRLPKVKLLTLLGERTG